MKRLALLCVALLCAPTSQAQEAVMGNGRPALRFTGESGTSTLVEDVGGSELTLRFSASDVNGSGCYGRLNISAAKVQWESLCSMTSFEVPRSEVSAVARGFSILHRKKLDPSVVSVRLGGKEGYYLVADPNKRTNNGFYYPLYSTEATRLLELSLQDFPAAEKEFNRLTAAVRPAQSPAGQPKLPPPPPPPTLALSLQPANVQVYVDDIFKGMTSAEGRLVIEGLAPGTHRVRMNLIGYTESARTVELKPGETATIEAKLEAAGPKPLALPEIEEALANGLPPRGITKLVKQYGVDFALTKEIEQRLREKGADSDLLLAVATNKK